MYSSALQLREYSPSSGVTLTFYLFLAFAFAKIRSTGPNNGFPRGIPIDANCNFPCNFSRSFVLIDSACPIFRNSSISFWHFFSGSCIVRAIPSNIQPNISLRASHGPRPPPIFWVRLVVPFCC